MDEGPTIDFTEIATELGFSPRQIETVVSLLDSGNTVPFITRYRKEATGDLDEEQIRRIQAAVKSRRQVIERAVAILRLIESQGKLTPKLRGEILAARTLKRLEDLYLPFRPKRRSRAATARERGLEPLADLIWNQDDSLSDLNAAAAAFVNPDQDVPDAQAALAGAADILAERIGENPEVRAGVRKLAWSSGQMQVKSTPKYRDDDREFRDYREYSEHVGRIPPHRILAINRGESAGVLRVRMQLDETTTANVVFDRSGCSSHRFTDFLRSCVEDAVGRLLCPAIEREVRRELTDKAEDHAVGVFVRNLGSLLMQPPLRGRRIVALDPGLRTGCKLAALDEYGRFLGSDVVYVTGSAERRDTAKQKLAEFIRTHDAGVVAIGNGTACRESEELVASLIEDEFPELRYVVVNEAGASIYSASTTAREEFPELDATVRGTISIGRRLQDPMSELVKIEARHLGIGMYQHDLNAKRLQESLEEVIESCVNRVGVDLNNASASLLRHVSGLNQLSARRIAEWRQENGRFRSRAQLRDVPGIGESTFTQAAGFLRIADGDEPLDSTWIHPESYAATRDLLKKVSLTTNELFSDSGTRDQLATIETEPLAGELGIGTFTVRDIIDSLLRPGRDPRVGLDGPVFKQGVLKLSDLAEGMELTGTVLNVVDFGAFVDVGLKESGLVHISRMSTQFVRCPHDVVSVGDAVTVWVLSVDAERQRVALAMVRPGTPEQTTQPPKRRSEANHEQSKPKNEHSGRRRRKKQKASSGNRQRSRSTDEKLPEVSDDVSEGRAPMRGFDELKAVWKKRGES